MPRLSVWTQARTSPTSLNPRLPDIDGVDVLKRVREFYDVPVIILTARADEASCVRGLEAGADDYVTKPFSHIELLARTRAVLRRPRGSHVGDQTAAVTVGGVTVDGEEINLTPIEWSQIGYFVRNQGKVAQHHVLAEKVWGTNAIDPSVIKTAVLRLRKKLGDHAPADLICTDRGLGYSFAFATNLPRHHGACGPRPLSIALDSDTPLEFRAKTVDDATRSTTTTAGHGARAIDSHP
jgi:DNA-binding response OmpR family regulator